MCRDLLLTILLAVLQSLSLHLEKPWRDITWIKHTLDIFNVYRHDLRVLCALNLGRRPGTVLLNILELLFLKIWLQAIMRKHIAFGVSGFLVLRSGTYFLFFCCWNFEIKIKIKTLKSFPKLDQSLTCL